MTLAPGSADRSDWSMPWSADFITDTFESEFSAHTGAPFDRLRLIPIAVDADSPPSLPGLTRQSITLTDQRLFSMDARVKPRMTIEDNDGWYKIAAGNVCPIVCAEEAIIMMLGRLRLSVADARDLAEARYAASDIINDEARIIADHVIDAAMCGYEYSGLAKILTCPRANTSGCRPIHEGIARNRGFACF